MFVYLLIYLSSLYTTQAPIVKPSVAFLLVFLLANSWVGQNSGSIELYFLFYFRIDCGWIVGSAEAKNRRKSREGTSTNKPPMLDGNNYAY